MKNKLKKNPNKSLFWYGFRARLMKAIGLILFFVSLMVLFINLFLGIIGIALGIFLLVIGASREYDYKRQGGYIVYDD